MEPDGTTEVRPGVQDRGGEAGSGARGVDGTGGSPEEIVHVTHLQGLEPRYQAVLKDHSWEFASGLKVGLENVGRARGTDHGTGIHGAPHFPAWPTEMSRGSLSVPRTVWVLGFVSMFMDISSEIIHALLPLFMTTTLGLSVAMVGLVDGIAEATANLSKIFSGYVSDRIGRRKPLILLGYGLGAASKPLFPLAAGALPIFAARFADRIGKGIRGAPRDALIADVTPVEARGRAFGLRQSLDTVGAFVGPLIAILLMALLANDMRLVFWIAVVPALVAVGLVLVGVEDGAPAAQRARVPIRFSDLRKVGIAFWAVTAIGVMFALARISEAFLILKANAEGLPLVLAPLVLVAMNLVFSLGAYPAGALSDRMKPRSLLLWGMLALVAADLLLAFAINLPMVFAGIVLWGVHMALSQGILARMIADTAPESVRGSAFGIFSLASGVALLLASVIAGLLWDQIGPNATFLAAAGFAAATSTALLLWGHKASRTGGDLPR